MSWESQGTSTVERMCLEKGSRPGHLGRERGNSAFEDMSEGEGRLGIITSSTTSSPNASSIRKEKGPSPTSRSKTLSFFDAEQIAPTPPPNPLSRGNSLNQGSGETLRKSTGSWLDRTTERLVELNHSAHNRQGGSWLDRSLSESGLPTPLNRSYHDPSSGRPDLLQAETYLTNPSQRYSVLSGFSETDSPASTSRPVTPTIPSVSENDTPVTKPALQQLKISDLTSVNLSQPQYEETPVVNSGNLNSLPSVNETSSKLLSPKSLLSPMSRYSTLPSLDPTEEPKRTSSSTKNTSASQTLEEGAAPQVGDIIGDYEVLKILGKGAFSRVALSKCLRIDSRGSTSPQSTSTSGRKRCADDGLVALKLIAKSSYKENERMRSSVIREIEALRSIEHTCLVGLLATFPTPEYTVLVLEYSSGGELFDFLADWHTEVSECLARRIFSELSLGVDYMHRSGLVHRDIKLENILLTSRPFPCADPKKILSTLPNPFVKLTDFGLSRFISTANPLLTTRCGSEAYAAPELLMGQQYDGRKTDAWALGVVLFAIITGGMPFVEAVEGLKGRRAYLVKIAKAEYRWPNPLASELLSPTTPVLADVDSAENHLMAAPVLGESFKKEANSHTIESARLVTPAVKTLTGMLLTRDPAKRSNVEDIWESEWMQGEGKVELVRMNHVIKRNVINDNVLSVRWRRGVEE